jgi:hypothetical protein
MILAFVGIVIAIALGVVALLRPAAQAAAPVEAVPQYSELQVADAKKAVCGAYDKTKKAVAGAATQSSTAPTVTFVIAVNTRLATQFSARFIKDTLKENPATPSQLSNSILTMSTAWNEIVLAQLSGVSTNDPGSSPCLQARFI